MAASTHWLLTAVNMYIYILVRMLPAALPLANTPSLLFSQASPAVSVLASSAPSQVEGQFLSSELVSSQGVSQQARPLAA